MPIRRRTTKKSASRPTPHNFSRHPKVPFSAVREDHRKVSTACPQGYMDFRTRSFGDPITTNNKYKYLWNAQPIPNYCIEVRARIKGKPTFIGRGNFGPS